MRIQIHQRSNTTNQIMNHVNFLNNNVSTVNEELSLSVLSNNLLNQTTKTTSSEIERIQLENKSIQKEIFETIKEKDEVIFINNFLIDD